MIQDFFHIFKTYFNKKLQQPAFHNEPGFNDIDKIEQLCADHVLHCRWSLDALISHSYHGEKCSSPHLRYYQQYSRHYITFHHTVEDHILDVHVYLCESDGHFHAVLPSVFITPYSPYSIFFVLRVLFLKNHSKMTVAQITEQFQISVSTLYRWIAKYKVILRIFQQLKDRYQMHLFIHMMYDHTDLCAELYDITGEALFEQKRKIGQLHHNTNSYSSP